MKYKSGLEVKIGDIVACGSKRYVVKEVWNDRTILLEPKRILEGAGKLDLLGRKQ